MNLISLLLLTALTLIYPPGNVWAGDGMELAEAAERRGDIQEAIRQYRAVAKSKTSNRSSALLEQARLLISQDKTAIAVAQLETYLTQNDPLDISVRLFTVKTLLDAGLLSMAREHVNIAKKFRPNDTEVNLSEGTVFIAENNFLEALKVTDIKGESPEQSIRIFVIRAAVLLGLKRFDDVLAQVRTILTFDPEHTEARMIYSEAQLGKGNKLEALKNISDNPGLFSKDQHIALRAAVVLEAVGDVRLAKETIRNVVALHPSDRELALRYLDLCRKTKDLESGLEHLKVVYEAQPENDDVVHTLASVYMEMKEHDQAARVLEQFSARFPDRTWAAVSYGKALLLAGSGQVAKGVLAKNIKLSPDPADAVALYCMILDDEGDAKGAMEQAIAFQKQFPADDRYRIVVAELFARRGAAYDAKRTLSAIRSDAPEIQKAKTRVGSLLTTVRAPASKSMSSIEDKLM